MKFDGTWMDDQEEKFLSEMSCPSATGKSPVAADSIK